MVERKLAMRRQRIAYDPRGVYHCYGLLLRTGQYGDHCRESHHGYHYHRHKDCCDYKTLAAHPLEIFSLYD